jgi:large subunit ribosomal protein L19
MDAHHLVSVTPNPKVPPFRPGDTVQVNYIIREGERVRTQTFQGVVIRCVGGKSPVATFTVRRVSHGIGVERIFPLYSPHVDSVNVLRHGKVRRARLYYLRDRFGRAARIKERVVLPGQRAVAVLPQVEKKIEAEAVEEVAAEPVAVAVGEGVAEVVSEETTTVAETEAEAAPVAQAAAEEADATSGVTPPADEEENKPAP